ncbi:MAG: hypothetical protein ACFNYD_08305, partial [Bacteroides sp.]
ELSQFFDGQIVIVSSVNEDDEKISSTRIRQAIKEGRVADATKVPLARFAIAYLVGECRA